MHKISVVIVLLAVLSLTAPQAALAASHGGGKAKAVEVTPAMLTEGKAVYETNCAVCHGSGVAGAPKFGDKVVCRITEWRSKHLNPEGEIVKVLGRSDDFSSGGQRSYRQWRDS